MDDERVVLIKKLTKYRLHLEKNKEDLLSELYEYYNQRETISDSKIGLYQVEKVSDDIKPVIMDNPYEIYLLAQIKLSKLLPQVIDSHVSCLGEKKDINLVVESLEYEIYRIKKDVYFNIESWNKLLSHISNHRLAEIEKNPKGPGDLLIKELIWIRNYENRLEERNEDKNI